MPILKRRKPSEEEVEIPTASMADIAFLLIIFFLTTTIFAREKGLKLVLPEKGTQVKVKTENILKIQINDRGEIFVKDQKIQVNQIQEIVKQAIAENPKVIILIKTHVNAPYERMIQVFDEVKQVPEATRVALGTIKPEVG